MKYIENCQSTVMHHDDDVSNRLHRLVQSDAYVGMRTSMLDMLALPSDVDMNIYDVGCGEGSLSRDIEKIVSPTSKIIGVDASKDVLKVAETHLSRGSSIIDYKYGSVTNLPVKSKTADVVVFANALKYLKENEEQTQAAHELGRILKPSGRMLIVDGNDAEITYSGIDPGLSREIVDGYAEMQGNHYAGNTIGSICTKAGLIGVTSREINLTEANFNPRSAGFIMAQNMCEVLNAQTLSNPAKGLITPETTRRFFDELQAAAVKGIYRWRYDKFMQLGIKPTQ